MEAASYTRRPGTLPVRGGRLPSPLTTVARGPDTPRVKLVVAIVHNEDAGNLVTALLDKEFRATRLQSSGGFLKQSNATIILGVEDADVDEVMGIVRTNCTSRTQVVNPMPPIMEPRRILHALSARGRGRRRDRLRPPGRTIRATLSLAVATWVDALQPGAPDVVAAWRGIDEGEFLSVRREVRKRAGHGSADGIVTQLGTLATASAARLVRRSASMQGDPFVGFRVCWVVCHRGP